MKQHNRAEEAAEPPTLRRAHYFGGPSSDLRHAQIARYHRSPCNDMSPLVCLADAIQPCVQHNLAVDPDAAAYLALVATIPTKQICLTSRRGLGH